MCQIFVRNVTDIGAGGGCPQQKSTAGGTFVKNFWPQLRKTTTTKNYNFKKLQLPANFYCCKENFGYPQRQHQQPQENSHHLLMFLGYSCCKNHQQQDLTVFEYI